MGPEKLIQRPMSISSSADDLSEYEFFIRLVEHGGLTPLMWERTVGDAINLKGAKGKFLLQDDGRTCLFVASGTGLAPFISMIETLRGRGQSRDVVLLHGVSYDYDLAWRTQLTDLANGGGFPLRYVGTVSRPQGSPEWTGCTGRVEAILADQLVEHGLTAENTTMYLCGNPEMVSAVEEIATDWTALWLFIPVPLASPSRSWGWRLGRWCSRPTPNLTCSAMMSRRSWYEIRIMITKRSASWYRSTHVTS